MSAVMKLQRQQVQPLQSGMGYGGRGGRSYGQMDRYGMGMGPVSMGGPYDATGFGGRGGGRMGNMGRGECIIFVLNFCRTLILYSVLLYCIDAVNPGTGVGAGIKGGIPV